MVHQLAVDFLFMLMIIICYILLLAIFCVLLPQSTFFFLFFFNCQSKLDKLNSCCIVPKVSLDSAFQLELDQLVLGHVSCIPLRDMLISSGLVPTETGPKPNPVSFSALPNCCCGKQHLTYP
jgi:hypothetical protein